MYSFRFRPLAGLCAAEYGRRRNAPARRRRRRFLFCVREYISSISARLRRCWRCCGSSIAVVCSSATVCHITSLRAVGSTSRSVVLLWFYVGFMRWGRHPWAVLMVPSWRIRGGNPRGNVARFFCFPSVCGRSRQT